MPEPCRTCPERAADFGGCRCQAYHLTGDMTVTDPSCALAPDHDIVRRARTHLNIGATASGTRALEASTPTTPPPDPDLIRLRRPPTVPLTG